MIGCKEAVRQLWEYLEDDLGEADRAVIDEHLALCRRCCGEVEFAKQLSGMLRDASRPHLPADVRERLDRSLGAIEGEETK